jgi:hypothetical protein
MPNALLTTDKIADRALMRFSENATFLKGINRDYDDSFAQKEAKIGDTLRVPIPQHGKYRKGRVADITPLQTIVRPVTVFGQRGFDIQYSSAEMALDIEEFDRRYLSQQVADFVINLEAEVLAMAVAATPNQTGPITDPFDATNTIFYSNMAKKLIEDNGGFKGTKKMLLNSTAEVQTLNARSGLFNSQKQISVQYEEGEMGRAQGFDWNTSTVLPVQLRGTGDGDYDTNGVAQVGSSIGIDSGLGTILKGEIVTFAGVNAVHPQTKQNLGYLRQFVVTEDFAGGTGNLQVYPAVVATGTEQNVSNAVADGQAVVIAGAASTPYPISLAYTRDAYTFGTVDLPEYPDRPCSRRVFESISMRTATGSDMVNDVIMMRFDIMAAFGALRPEWAARLGDDGSLDAPGE